MGGDWKLDHARRIYRRLGNREKYLELRQRQLSTGTDYFDLADFHWKAGEKQKAMEVAEEGLLRGKGCMDELRQFVAKRAKSAGNRKRYLTLQFDQAIDHLTCDKYKAFRKLCTAAEWTRYEAKILAQLENAWDTEQLRIRMHRKEDEEAVAVLTRSRYPINAWDSAYQLQTAKRLESRYPKAILEYYLSGLGNIKTNATRVREEKPERRQYLHRQYGDGSVRSEHHEQSGLLRAVPADQRRPPGQRSGNHG